MSVGSEAGNLAALQREFFEKLDLCEGDHLKFLGAMEGFSFSLGCFSRECLGELAEAFEIREKPAAREEEIFGDVSKLFDALEAGE